MTDMQKLAEAGALVRRWDAVLRGALLMGWPMDAAIRLAAAVCDIADPDYPDA